MWDSEDPQVIFHSCPGVNSDVVFDFQLAELAHDLFFFIGDADYYQLVCEFSVYIIQPRYGPSALPTPCSPECDKNVLAANIRLVCEPFLDNKIGGLCPQTGRSPETLTFLGHRRVILRIERGVDRETWNVIYRDTGIG